MIRRRWALWSAVLTLMGPLGAVGKVEGLAGKMKALSDLIADASAPVLRQLVAS